uniref:Uncharacterized protein n=1 Tax=Lactuca sativa TaxID=4236 RepID=A0A9R1XPH7_LACSA|nr:hypothetical protein LSAT_V11C300127260 [Lactuca sativa]
MFEHTHKRIDGRVYAHIYDDTAKENCKSLYDCDKIKENGGYHRIYGRDFINKLIKKSGLLLCIIHDFGRTYGIWNHSHQMNLKYIN